VFGVDKKPSIGLQPDFPPFAYLLWAGQPQCGREQPDILEKADNTTGPTIKIEAKKGIDGYTSDDRHFFRFSGRHDGPTGTCCSLSIPSICFGSLDHEGLVLAGSSIGTAR